MIISGAKLSNHINREIGLQKSRKGLISTSFWGIHIEMTITWTKESLHKKVSKSISETLFQ